MFCVDTEHADDMRLALAIENPDLVSADPEWVVGIKGERERLLADFTNPDRSSPFVGTTSRVLSMGVDVEDLELVVLFRPVGSMVEFKQITGRGTRLFPDKGKTSFEIVDYVGATRLSEDPEFDGYPTDIRVETVDSSGAVVGLETDVVAENSSTAAEDDEATRVEEPVAPFDVHDPADPTQVPSGLPPRRKFYVDEGEFYVGQRGAAGSRPRVRSAGAHRVRSLGPGTDHR